MSASRIYNNSPKLYSNTQNHLAQAVLQYHPNMA